MGRGGSDQTFQASASRGSEAASAGTPGRPLSDEAKAFLDSLGFSDKPAFSPSFIPSRYPFTYAYDFVRSHTPQMYGRGEVAGLLRQFMHGDDEARTRVCFELADAYIREHGIVVTDEDRQRIAAQ